MSDLSGQFCGQTQPHEPHAWTPQFQSTPQVWRHCAGHASRPAPGPCFHDSGVDWPNGERPRCDLLAGHEGAHTWQRPNGGEAVWFESFGPERGPQ